MFSQFAEFKFGWSSNDIENPTLDDYIINGQYCKSGLAYYDKSTKGAKCADTIKIMQDGNTLTPEKNYSCNPLDNEKPCMIYYTPDEFLSVPCKCALDGSNNGYCASVIGTNEYRESRQLLKDTLEGNRCHTYDRDSWLSKMDDCAMRKEDQLPKAVDKNFEIEHWPYIHNKTIRECFL